MDVVASPGDILAALATWVIGIGSVLLIALAAARRRPDAVIEALRTRPSEGHADEAEDERLRSTLQRG